MEIIISNIVLSMRDFQKENNIKKQCVTNTQYLYDTIKYYGYGMNFIKIYIPTNCNIKKNNHNLITVSTVK
jgi:hypothetical protein